LVKSRGGAGNVVRAALAAGDGAVATAVARPYGSARSRAPSPGSGTPRQAMRRRAAAMVRFSPGSPWRTRCLYEAAGGSVHAAYLITRAALPRWMFISCGGAPSMEGQPAAGVPSAPGERASQFEARVATSCVDEDSKPEAPRVFKTRTYPDSRDGLRPMAQKQVAAPTAGLPLVQSQRKARQCAALVPVHVGRPPASPGQGRGWRCSADSRGAS
jgi:hypothetical protein